MPAEVIETILRFKADASAVREIASEVDKLGRAVRTVQSGGLDKLAAGMSSFTAGAVLGGAVLGWFTAATAAAGAYTGALVSLTKTAGDNARELERLGLVTEEQADAAIKAAAGFEAMDVAGKLLGFTLAEDVGPTVARITRLFTAAGLAASDMAGKLGVGTALLSTGAQVAAGIIGGDQASKAVGIALNAGGTLGGVEGLVGDRYLAEAARLSSALTAEAEAHAKAAGAAKGHAAALEDVGQTIRRNGLGDIAWFAGSLNLPRTGFGGLMGNQASEATRAAGMTAANQGLNALPATANPFETANLAGASAFGAGLATSETANAAALDRQRGMATELVGIWTSAASSITSAMSGFFEGNAKAQKAWSLVSIAVNTAAAIVATFATNGGVNPVSLALAGTMATIGAINFAAAASGTMPGKPGGGMGSGAMSAGVPSWAQYEPGSQAGQGEQGGPGRSGRRDSRREVTIRTVGGFANVRDFVDEINRTGGAMRLRLGGA